MIKIGKKEYDFEILLSTMYRTSLSFLAEMFPEDNFLNYNILIVNQTSNDKLLKSGYTNIRIINSFEKGLSKSRNLAIKNAIGEVCLIADDDVKYQKNFKEIILDTYTKRSEADVVTFQMIDDAGKLFKAYPNITIHNKKTIKTVNSVTLTFRTERLKFHKVGFNQHFGLGAIFQNADEYVFLRNALKANLNVYFEPKVILSHNLYSSGKAVGSDRVIYALSAIFYKYSGVLAYPRLLKHLLFICKRKRIAFREIIPKYRVGLKGIKEYKRLVKLGSEKR
ncbi:glycosyltransferase family A protein [Flavivirga sp. 57AJ16]|uniref:glycosyltransferase family A protein n=1 Tax=Flavivirga sp. 57AJ16 TaxID=3025307 RepID=UPI00236702CD|nr:glycosyltransferase family A protein [Flavivirga sp. 57AJ16]MDD7885338.1 glycosyltransferase family A protein [Flavivirga sp. 57AJ16]